MVPRESVIAGFKKFLNSSDTHSPIITALRPGLPQGSSKEEQGGNRSSTEEEDDDGSETERSSEDSLDRSDSDTKEVKELALIGAPGQAMHNITITITITITIIIVIIIVISNVVHRRRRRYPFDASVAISAQGSQQMQRIMRDPLVYSQFPYPLVYSHFPYQRSKPVRWQYLAMTNA